MSVDRRGNVDRHGWRAGALVALFAVLLWIITVAGFRHATTSGLSVVTEPDRYIGQDSFLQELRADFVRQVPPGTRAYAAQDEHGPNVEYLQRSIEMAAICGVVLVPDQAHAQVVFWIRPDGAAPGGIQLVVERA